MIVTVPIIPSPYEHLSARPHSGVRHAANWRIRCADSCPTIRVGVISPAGVKEIRSNPAPYDHFTATPYCCVSLSGFGCIGGAGGCPAVSHRIISPAGIQVAGAIATAPDEHFTTGPDSRVIIPWRRCVDEVGRRPGISRRVVLSTGIQKEILSTIATPDDHLTPSPDRRVVYSCVGRIGGTCSSPRVEACAFRIQCGRYRRKSITREWSNCFPRTSSLALGPADITVSQGRRKQALRKR